jgi:predicted GIY-YIG superfamily endonuclease
MDDDRIYVGLNNNISQRTDDHRKARCELAETVDVGSGLSAYT